MDEREAHHSLMDQMGEMNDSTQAQDDYLAGVAKVAGAESSEPAESLGQRIRRLREAQGLTLEDLSQRTEIEPSVLEDIEADRISPPLGMLAKLGKALKMKLGRLITTGEPVAYTIVRATERKRISRFGSKRVARYGYEYMALAPLKADRSMEPLLVVLRPTSQEAPPSTHEGEEFIFVLEGKMEAIVGEAKEVLGPGDCIYYDSTVPHLVRPAGEEPVTILAVIYTPGA